MYFRGIYILVRKELAEMFLSPLIYILTGIFSMLMGWLFYNYLVSAQNLQSTTVHQTVLLPIFGNINFVFMFLAPLLAMRSLSEEKKMHTIELLLLSKIGHAQIVIAKYIALLVTAAFMVLFTVIFPLILVFSGHNDWGIVYTSYAGIMFSLGAYLAVGLFASSLTSNQIVSAFLGFGMLLAITLLAITGNATNNYIIGLICGYISPAFHYEAFSRGSVNLHSLLYFFTFNFFFLYLSVTTLDSRRW